MKAFTLEVLTPDRSLFSGSITSVTVPGSSGSFQVLANHAPIVSSLSTGKVKFVEEGGAEKSYYAEGGVIEVNNNKVSILLEKVREN